MLLLSTALHWYPCGAHGPQMRLSFQLTEFAFRVGTLFDEPMCMHAWGVSLRVCTQCTFFSTNEVNDGPLQEPQYYSYTDPNMGEPSPTFGARNPLADMALWGEDMFHIKRTSQASTLAPSSSTSEQQQQPSTPSAQLC